MAPKGKVKGKDGGAVGEGPQFDDPGTKAKLKKLQIVKREEASRVIPFLSHLPQYESHSGVVPGDKAREMHPAVVKLGAQYATGCISGASARAVALVETMIQVISDFSLSSDRDRESKDLRRELDKEVKRCVQFVIDCRAMAVPMGNFIRFLRTQILNLPGDLLEHDAKQKIVHEMREYMETKLSTPHQAIIRMGSDRAISANDVVLIVGRSYLVEQTLVRAASVRKVSFRVVIIESRPHRGGLLVARKLSALGVKVEYGLVSAVGYLLPSVTKVIIGAHGFLSNGAVLSRIGTAAVATLAKMQRTPVIVVCESVKFSERVQLDSLVFNELGDADRLLLSSRDRDINVAIKPYSPSTGNQTQPSLTPIASHMVGGDQRAAQVLDENWRAESEKLRLLNLNYDLTPIDLIDAVISDVGVVPASSVPVIIREQTI